MVKINNLVSGIRHFDFVPKTFIIPSDQIDLQEEMERDINQWWICKPSASSQGKGIFVTNNFYEVLVIVCSRLDTQQAEHDC